MKGLRNIHPGEVLLQEFLIPMDLPAKALAHEIASRLGAWAKLFEANGESARIPPFDWRGISEIQRIFG